jgi:ribosomal protein S12 methylthiotransferase accessory factor
VCPVPDPGLFLTGDADAALLARLGITRVGDITDLDNIGIPVWFATRPNSRALSVAQGKGVDPATARLSAIMEAAETASAERSEDLIAQFATVDEMVAGGRAIVPFDRLLRCSAARIAPDRRFGWAAGYGVRSGTPIFAPYELIGLDLRSDAGWDHGAFRMSSIGLAAGADRVATIAHALLEVVEHDATAALDLFGLAGSVAESVTHTTGEHTGLDRLIASLRAAGFEPSFFDLRGRFGLPVIGCFLDRLVASEDGMGATLTAGFACRPDAHEAAIAALLECVQSRATDIAGSRDDIAAGHYRGSRARLPAMTGTGKTLHDVTGHLPREAFPTNQARLDHILDRVLQHGSGEIYCFPLAPADLGIDVVRVLVPDLSVQASSSSNEGGASILDALMKVLA